MTATDPTITRGRIAQAYETLTLETGWEYVSIRQLREHLAGIPRAELDAVLTGMYAGQAVNLIPQSNQQALTQADRGAAVRCSGEDKHLMSWAVKD